MRPNRVQSGIRGLINSVFTYATAQSLLIVLINFCGYTLCVWLTSLETHIIGAHALTSMTFKLTIFYIFNALIMLFTPAVQNNKRFWCAASCFSPSVHALHWRVSRH